MLTELMGPEFRPGTEMACPCPMIPRVSAGTLSWVTLSGPAEHSGCLLRPLQPLHPPKLRTLLLTASVRIKQDVCPEPGCSGVKQKERAESYNKLLILISDMAAALGARAAASSLLYSGPFPGAGEALREMVAEMKNNPP